MQSLKQTYDVVVVGGGMVGSITALALAENNFKVALVEKTAPKPISENYHLRVSALAPYSVQYLKNIGLWNNILSSDRTCRVDSMVVLHSDQQAVDVKAEFIANEKQQSEVAYVVENDLIQLEAWQVLKSHANVSLYVVDGWGELEINRESASIRLSDGKNLQAKLLIASDGKQSQLRKALGIDFNVLQYNQSCVVGTVRTEKNHQNKCWQIYYPHGCFAFLSLGENICSIAWYIPKSSQKELQSKTESEILALVQKASHNLLGRVERLYNWASFPLYGGQAETYCHHRVALIGDAAHSIHPQAGQGLNLGLLDSAELVDTLIANKIKDYGRISILSQYENRRRFDNELLIRSMETISSFFEKEKLQKVRKITMRLLNNSPTLSKVFGTLSVRPRLGVPSLMQKFG